MSETVVPATGPGNRHTFVASFRGGVEPSKGGNPEPALVGHGIVFDSWSEVMHTRNGSFRERIAKGALDDVLSRNPDVRLLFNHDGIPLGRTKSGTLDLSPDEDGLRVWSRIHPSRTDILSALERRDVDQMSFAFGGDDLDDEWRETDDPGLFERTITRIGQLYDVSLVTYPAYPDTDAALRELRSAADAGKIVLPEVGEADASQRSADEEPDDAAPDEPVDDVEDEDAPQDDDLDADEERSDAPDEPVAAVSADNDSTAEFKASARERRTDARESYLRLLKEHELA